MSWIPHPPASLAPHAVGPLDLDLNAEAPAPQAHPEVVLITCTDADCLDGLLTRMDTSRMLILRTPRDAAPADGDAEHGLLAALEPAVAGGRLKEILVCGHSRCRALRDGRGHRPGTPPAPDENASGRGFHRLIRGVQESAAMLSRTKANVVAQLEALLANPVIAGAAIRGDLTLQGWIYLAESGLFLGYDPECDRFVPISAGVATAIA